ncbi:hypothetical protein UCDDA912_g06496 [Diaporthe ampelina]|uniref:Uncharacterized protein n=1 Tax=Diaporthe ampelina TaxID=1214573 RepID=A0A0G2FG91_9PEZI|nr:hypothetical protein UCDDA912_g06496 [Diaporthe ampelina]
MANPGSPAFTPQIVGAKQSQDVREVHPDAIVFRLARNRAALDALRRTRKMRYRQNLKFLAKSFPLADEVATRNKQAREEADEAQGLTSDERLAQKEIAERKKTEMTVEELKYIKEMKAAKVKEAATKRLQLARERADKNEAVEKAVKRAGQKSLRTKLMPRKPIPKKAVEKAFEKPSASQTTAKPFPKNIFAMPAQKKVVEEPAPEKIIKEPVANQTAGKPVAKKQAIVRPAGKAMLKPIARKIAAETAAKKGTDEAAVQKPAEKEEAKRDAPSWLAWPSHMQEQGAAKGKKRVQVSD